MIESDPPGWLKTSPRGWKTTPRMIGNLDQNGSHFWSNLEWKSGPKPDPIFDQTRDGNLDPNQISFLIKLGMEIWSQIGTHFWSNPGRKSGPKSDLIFDLTRDGNLDQNRISFLINLGMEIWTKIGSHFWSNPGRKSGPKSVSMFVECGLQFSAGLDHLVLQIVKKHRDS